MAFGYSESESEQSSGLDPSMRYHISSMIPSRFRETERFSREAAGDPGGREFLDFIDKDLLQIGKYGLPTGATEGIYQLGRDLFANASGSRAQRGFGQASNLEGVLGDAIRMASGQLIPISTQVALKRAELAPSLRQAKFGYQMTPMQTLQQLLAGSGGGTSSAFGFNAAGPRAAPASGG